MAPMVPSARKPATRATKKPPPSAPNPTTQGQPLPVQATTPNSPPVVMAQHGSPRSPPAIRTSTPVHGTIQPVSVNAAPVINPTTPVHHSGPNPSAPWDLVDPRGELDLDVLTLPFPQGFNLSSTCSEWMRILGISDLEDFFGCSTLYNLHSVMSTLTIPVYDKYKWDVMIFLKVGSFYKTHGATTIPSLQELQTTWIPKMVKQLRYESKSPAHIQAENQARLAIQETPHCDAPLWSLGGRMIEISVSAIEMRRKQKSIDQGQGLSQRTNQACLSSQKVLQNPHTEGTKARRTREEQRTQQALKEVQEVKERRKEKVTKGTMQLLI